MPRYYFLVKRDDNNRFGLGVAVPDENGDGEVVNTFSYKGIALALLYDNNAHYDYKDKNALELFYNGIAIAKIDFNDAQLLDDNENLDWTPFPFDLLAGSEVTSRLEYTCGNKPDGNATITALLRASDGTHIEIEKSFNFMQEGAFDVVFNYLSSGILNYYGATLEGYLFTSDKGFTAGSIQFQEYWFYIPTGWPEFLTNERLISFNDGDRQKFVNINGWLYSLAGSLGAGYLSIPAPIGTNGTVSLNCDFADLPECNDDVLAEAPLTVSDYIEQHGGDIYIPPVEPLFPVPPVEPPDFPEPPEPPTSPVPPEPVLPFEPTEPEAGCECEIYLAKLLGGKVEYLAALLSRRLHDLNLTQKYLIESQAFQNQLLLSKLSDFEKRFFVTDDDGTDRSIAKILDDKEFDPLIHVDTNSCWWKEIPPPEGNQ